MYLLKKEKIATEEAPLIEVVAVYGLSTLVTIIVAVGILISL